MPRKIRSQAQARFVGAIIGGKRPPSVLGFRSVAEARESLRGVKVKGLPKKIGKPRKKH